MTDGPRFMKTHRNSPDKWIRPSTEQTHFWLGRCCKLPNLQSWPGNLYHLPTSEVNLLPNHCLVDIALAQKLGAESGVLPVKSGKTHGTIFHWVHGCYNLKLAVCVAGWATLAFNIVKYVNLFHLIHNCCEDKDIVLGTGYLRN